MSELWPAFKSIIVVAILSAAWAAFNYIFNRASPAGALSTQKLPIVLTSGGTLYVPNLAIGIFGAGVLCYGAYVISGAPSHVGLLMPVLMIISILGMAIALLCFSAIGMVNAFYPTIVTISEFGVTREDLYGRWFLAWNDIDDAVVKVSRSAQWRYAYVALVRSSKDGSPGILSKLGMARDPNIFFLPSMLRSSAGVESANTICGFLNGLISERNSTATLTLNDTAA